MLGQDEALLGSFDGEIVCEPPNNLLNKFEGTLLWNGNKLVDSWKRFSKDESRVKLFLDNKFFLVLSTEPVTFENGIANSTYHSKIVVQYFLKYSSYSTLKSDEF